MLTNTPCVHLIKNSYFAGIHSFATQLNEYKQLQDTVAMNNLNPSLSATCRDVMHCVSTIVLTGRVLYPKTRLCHFRISSMQLSLLR